MPNPAQANGDFVISSPSPSSSTFNRDQVPHAGSGDTSYGDDDDVSGRQQVETSIPAVCERLKHVLSEQWTMEAR